MRTVLIVGSGGSAELVVECAAEHGLRPLRAEGTEPAVAETVRETGPSGVLAVSDSAVQAVAAVTAALGVPGIDTETAHLVTHRVALRRRLAESGVPQTAFAAVRTLHEARTAVGTVGYPSVVAPANAPGSHISFMLEEDSDLESHLHAALAESPTQEAIVERVHDGRTIDAVAIARHGHVEMLAVLDRVSAQMEVHPSTLFGDPLAAVEDAAVRALRAVGFMHGVGCTQLVVSDDGLLVGSLSLRVPDPETVRLLRHALGVDLAAVAMLQAVGDEVPAALLEPPARRPAAALVLTGDPGPLPTGTVRSVGSLEKVLAFPGVVEAGTSLVVGSTITPARANGDRHGFVITTGDTNLEARDRAEAAARLLDVEVW